MRLLIDERRDFELVGVRTCLKGDEDRAGSLLGMDSLARAEVAVRQLCREPQLARFAPLPNRGPITVVPVQLGRRFCAHRGPERKAAFR